MAVLNPGKFVVTPEEMAELRRLLPPADGCDHPYCHVLRPIRPQRSPHEGPMAIGFEVLDDVVTFKLVYGCSGGPCYWEPMNALVDPPEQVPRPSKPWAPIAGLRTIFHPRGRFTSPEGKRFDYVFPELIKRPDVPKELLPSIWTLSQGRDAPFLGRHEEMARMDERFTPVGRNRPRQLT